MNDPSDVVDQWGPNITRARRARKLTQEELGRKVGVAAFSVSRWETGSTKPDLELQRRIASALGMKLLQLFPRDDYEASLVTGADGELAS